MKSTDAVVRRDTTFMLRLDAVRREHKLASPPPTCRALDAACPVMRSASAGTSHSTANRLIVHRYRAVSTCRTATPADDKQSTVPRRPPGPPTRTTCGSAAHTFVVRIAVSLQTRSKGVTQFPQTRVIGRLQVFDFSGDSGFLHQRPRRVR